MAETRLWFFPRALARGYDRPLVERVWKVIEAFASFGFCKAHAAAFALPTYQSAWLKAHYPAHFLSGVLTHDPGMYPKRLILDDARQLGITILGLDVNASEDRTSSSGSTRRPRSRRRVLDGRCGESLVPVPAADAPSVGPGSGYGIRLALAEVKGISEAEVDRIVAARPPSTRSPTSGTAPGCPGRWPSGWCWPGAFDAVYGIGAAGDGVRRRGRVTRRDLLLQVAELDRHARAVERAGRGRGLAGRRVAAAVGRPGRGPRTPRPATAPTRRPARAPRARAAPAGRAGDLGAGGRPVPGDRGRRPGRPRCSSPSTSATSRPRARRAGCRR